MVGEALGLLSETPATQDKPWPVTGSVVLINWADLAHRKLGLEFEAGFESFTLPDDH